MKPTEKEIEAAARVLCKASGSNPNAYYCGRSIRVWTLYIDNAQLALEAAYAVREADTVDVVTGEPEEEDLAIDDYGCFAQFGLDWEDGLDAKMRWLPIAEKAKFDDSNYRIIMRNDTVVLDKREKQ